MTGCDGEVLPAQEDLDSEHLVDQEPRVSHVPRPAPLLVPRPRLLARLDARTPLTILRGPVGFGKTTLVAQWLSQQVGTAGQPDELVAWLRVREGTDSAAFWSHAVQVAEDSGMQVPANPGDALARLERAVVTSPVPVVLVVDGLENAASSDLERSLLDLLRHAPRLRLVVCLRGLRQLPPHRYLDLETTEIDPAELRFTEEETAAFLTVAGVGVAPDAAQRIVEESGGWPESVRAVVLRLREAPATDAELSAVVRAIAAGHVHERLLADGDPPGRVEFALITSLPEEFTADLAESLTGDPASGDHLETLDPEGLLTAELREGQTVYRWPMAARQVMRDELARRWPERIGELHSRLARWYFAEGVAGAALRHAVDAEDWPLSIEIIEASWRDLVFQHNDQLWRAMTTIPPDLLKSSPRALAARDTKVPVADDLFLSIATLPGTEEELAELGRGEGAGELLETCFGVLVAWRHRGAFRRARVYGDRALAVARAARAVRPEVSSIYPTLHLQAGLTHLLAGDVDAAIPPLRLAYDRGADNPRGYVEADAAGKLALGYAFAGDPAQADIWVERHRANSHSGYTWLEPHINHGSVVARLLVALDRLDLERAEATHDELVALTHREEFWAFAAHARAEFALSAGTAAEALDVLDRARIAYDAWFTPESFARPLLAAAEANLLLALGRANLARGVLAGTDAEHPLLRVPLTRLALLAGQTDRVLQLTQDSHWERGASTRQRLEMLLMRTVAAARAGDVALAAVVLRGAVDLARTSGLLRPFVTVPRAELLALADAVPAVRELLEQPPLAGLGDLYPPEVELIELSDREEQVLEQLATDLTIPEIASASVLSYNTVRTQQRSLYKKLGTSDRAEAVALARQLGLLPER